MCMHSVAVSTCLIVIFYLTSNFLSLNSHRMAIIDSEAAFMDRAKSFGLGDAELQILKGEKYASFGAFTFVASYSPNSSDDKPLRDALASILGSEPSPAQMGKWRRLHFESHALTVTDARMRMEGPTDDQPKKLPTAERASRYELQKKRITGIIWNPSIEPSHSLVDRVQQQIEDNQGAYIPLDLCTSRLQEIGGLKKDKEITAIIEPNHNLKISTKEPEARAPIVSDLNLRNAFRRRALAYDQCNLISYEVLEKWTERLFTSMDEIPPPSYSQVSRHQILAADKALFVKIIEECRAGISPNVDAGGNVTRPLEEAFQIFSNDNLVTFNLLPLPRGSGNKARFGASDEEDSFGPKKRRSEPFSKGKGKGKGKGKTKGGNSDQDKLPQALAGCWKNVKGKKACKYFNMNICRSDARPGDECSNGVHLCMAPGCGQSHPAASCDKNPANRKKKE